MNYKDIINFLFNKKEDEELFDLEDSKREMFKNKSSIAYDEIIKFIDLRVHPKSRNKLKDLLSKYDDVECEYLRKENELLYRNGIADGVKFIITVLSTKWQSLYIFYIEHKKQLKKCNITTLMIHFQPNFDKIWLKNVT